MLASAIAGLAAGGAYALLAICVVFTYRVVAVVNFTAAGLGAFGAFVTVVLHEDGVALVPAIVVGTLAGTAVAALLGAVMAIWFAEATPSTKAAVSVALLVGLLSLGLRAFGSQHPHRFPEPFPGEAFALGGAVVTVASLVTVVMAAGLAAGMSLFLRRTHTGLRLRALAERPTTAQLLGVPSRRLSIGVWAATGALTTLAIVVIAPSRTPTFASLTLLIVPALAAALVGLFQRLGLAFAGGVALGMLEGVASGIDEIQQYRGVLPFAVILAVLLWSQRGMRWDEAR